MSIRLPEISYEPYFYYPRPGLTIPELVIPEHLKDLIAEARGTIRFDYDGYTPVIKDTLDAHISRVSRLALAVWYINEEDKQDVCNSLLIHDLPELRKEKKRDMTATDKKKNPQLAVLIEAQEREVARAILMPDDYLRFSRYETAKPLLEGKVDPTTTEVIPNAILGKVFDVFENETYHHTWIQYLWSIYGEQIYNMLPPEDFTFSLARFRKYRANLIKLGLPEAHLQLSMELFDEAEEFARVSFQRED